MVGAGPGPISLHQPTPASEVPPCPSLVLHQVHSQEVTFVHNVYLPRFLTQPPSLTD